MTHDQQSAPAGPPLAEEARYAALAGLIDQLEKAASKAHEDAKSVYRTHWYSGEEAAFRKAIEMARQWQHNETSSATGGAQPIPKP